MIKKKILLCTSVIALFSLLFAACNSEETEQSFSEVPAVTLYTGNKDEIPSTRTTINEEGNVLWNTSDIIFVNGVPSTKTTVSNSGSYAEFTVNANPPYSAIYPASMIADFTPYEDGWLYKIVLPPTQPYKNTITFADGVNPSIAYSLNESLVFQNLCGILQVQIKSNISGVRKVRFVSKDNLVSGLANVYVNGTSTNQSLEIIDGKKIVDVVFDFDRNFSEYVPINISWILPAGSYEQGWAISLLSNDDHILTEGAMDSFTIVRSQKTNLGEINL